MAINTDQRLIEVMRKISRLESQGNYREASLLRNAFTNTATIKRKYTTNLKHYVK